MTVVDARRLTALGAGLLTLVAVVGPAAGESPSTDAARNLVRRSGRRSPGVLPARGLIGNDLTK